MKSQKHPVGESSGTLSAILWSTGQGGCYLSAQLTEEKYPENLGFCSIVKICVMIGMTLMYVKEINFDVLGIMESLGGKSSHIGK